MTTTGHILKDKLHLNNFSQVRIRRLVTGGSLRTYQIVFNSRTPQMPLTTFLLNFNILSPKIVSGDAKEFSATPWADIENFNNLLNPAIYFVTDLAGFYGKEDNYSEKIYRFDNKLEEITIPELRKVDAYTSSLTQKYKDLRLQFQGQGIKNTKLIDSKYIEATGDLQFLFLTEATEDKSASSEKDKHKVGKEYKQQFNISSDSLERNTSKTYDMILEIDNIFPNKEKMSWLEVYDGEEIDRKMMKEILDVADCKIWDSTPAFQYQGFRYRLTNIDASIYPESRPDTFWKSKHGIQAYLDKHWSQLLDRGTLDLFLNNMLSILIKYCKQLDYAKRAGKGKLIINTSGE